MRFKVEPSPAGGWYVRLAGHHAPVSRHDTEEEALARAAAYECGAAVEGKRVTLRDGSRIVVRPVVPEDRPLFVEGWERFGETSRQRRFMGVKQRLTLDDLAFFTEPVVDAWQGKGLGGVLLQRLAERARAHGIRHFSAELMADNRAMLHLFDGLGAMTSHRDAGDLEIDVELPLEDADSLGSTLRAAAAGDVAPR